MPSDPLANIIDDGTDWFSNKGDRGAGGLFNPGGGGLPGTFALGGGGGIYGGGPAYNTNMPLYGRRRLPGGFAMAPTPGGEGGGGVSVSPQQGAAPAFSLFNTQDILSGRGAGAGGPGGTPAQNIPFDPNNPWGWLQGDTTNTGGGILARLLGNAGAAGIFDPQGNPLVADAIRRNLMQGNSDAQNQARLSAMLNAGGDPALAAYGGLRADLNTSRDLSRGLSEAQVGQLEQQQQMLQDLMKAYQNYYYGHELAAQGFDINKALQNNAQGGGGFGSMLGGLLGTGIGSLAGGFGGAAGGAIGRKLFGG